MPAFELVPVYRSGTNLRLSAGGAFNITDVTTGDPLVVDLPGGGTGSVVSADSEGKVTFDTGVTGPGVVVATSTDGVSWSQELVSAEWLAGAASPTDALIAAAVGNPASATSDALDEAYVRRDAAPVSLAVYGVLPAASSAANVAGFAAAAASGLTSFRLPAGTYNIQLTEGGSLMSFTGKTGVKVVGDNAILNDTTTYTNNGPLTCMVLLNACKDADVRGIQYVGPVLGSPTTLHGYQGATLVRAINATTGVKVDMRATNCRYGLQTGEYGDATKGNCRNFELKLRGSMVGYPIAAYYAAGIRHDIDIDGVHRVAYIAGCDDVTGVARWKDQYIADTCYLITDALISGTDAVAETAPPANPTTSRGCSNIDVTSIDKGSTVFQPSSSCAGVTLSRVDPGTEFRNIKVRVYSTKATDTVSTKVGAFRVTSGAKAIWPRYAFNWENTITLENIEVSGVIDHSAATLAGNTGSELYVTTYDTNTTRSAVVRNFRVDGLTILTSSAATPRASYFQVPGLVSPARFARFRTPGLGLELYTNATYETVLDECTVATLNVAGVTGGSKVAIGQGTTITAQTCNVPVTNTATYGGSVGGAGPAIRQKEITLTLSGATTSWTTPLPAGCLALGVSGRVQTLITGATGYQVGVAGDVTRFRDTNTLTAGSTFVPANQATTETAARWYYAATDIVVTAKTSNFTGGTLRLVLSYIDFGTPSA